RFACTRSLTRHHASGNSAMGLCPGQIHHRDRACDRHTAQCASPRFLSGLGTCRRRQQTLVRLRNEMSLKFKETPGYRLYHGRRIEIVTRTYESEEPKRKRTFGAKWVKLPRHWISDLGRCRSANTYRLGMLILLAAYEDKRGTGEIVLSTKLTGDMDRATRGRA